MGECAHEGKKKGKDCIQQRWEEPKRGGKLDLGEVKKLQVYLGLGQQRKVVYHILDLAKDKPLNINASSLLQGC